MASIEEMFNEEVSKYAPEAEISPYDKVEAQVRREFLGSEEEERERTTREGDLKTKLADLRSKLRSNRNVKVVSATKINTERAEKRKKLRAQISELEVALEDLKLESNKPR